MRNTSAHLFIRTDCSATIGTGHFSRCLALAHAWMAQGGQVTYLSHCENEVLRARLQQNGIDLIPLDYSHPDPSDLKSTLRSLNEFRFRNPRCRMWTVLDGYHFDTGYQQDIHNDRFSILLIDDMNHLPYYDVDVLLNQNIHAPGLTYNCRADTILLLGLEYVLLRPEFPVDPGAKRNLPPIARKVLITLGGADPDNMTAKVVQALNRVDIPQMEAIVVMGPANPHEADVRRRLEQSHSAWRMLRAPNNMADLMEWADVAVSAGGSTCWEMCVMGVPFLTVVVADNQRPIASGLAAADVAVNLGWQGSITVDDIADRLSEVAHDLDRRSRMSRNGRLLIDGNGGKRVVSTILRAS